MWNSIDKDNAILTLGKRRNTGGKVLFEMKEEEDIDKFVERGWNLIRFLDDFWMVLVIYGSSIESNVSFGVYTGELWVLEGNMWLWKLYLVFGINYHLLN